MIVMLTDNIIIAQERSHSFGKFSTVVEVGGWGC